MKTESDNKKYKHAHHYETIQYKINHNLIPYNLVIVI